MQKLLQKKDDKKVEMMPITEFKGYYEFLSIEYPAPIYFEGFMFSSVATAFQAARTVDANIRRRISEVKGQEEFKKIVAQIKNRPDWPQRRLEVMQKLNRDKFKRNRDLGLKLFATQTRLLCNGYTKGSDAEAFWGVIDRNGKLEGLNSLGKILTTIREEIQTNIDSVCWVKDQNLEADQTLWPQANIIVEKQGDTVDNILLEKKNRFMFGSAPQNDVRLEHASISKFHASIYFSTDMEIVLVDLNSTHGTVIQREGAEIKLESLRPESLEKGDIIRFGMSTRRYTVYFSYDQVEARISQLKMQTEGELKKIQQIKNLAIEQPENASNQRNMIKSLLELKDYCCLSVENINRNFSYKDIKEAFNQYGPVKNIRINIDQKTGRFMGSVLIYYDQRIKVTTVLDNIQKQPLQFDFKISAVNSEEANKIISTFANKEQQERRRKEQEELARRNEQRQQADRRKRGDSRSSRSSSSRSRDRRRRRRRDSSDSSSSSSSSSSFSSRSRSGNGNA